jgi:hypothetical protein
MVLQGAFFPDASQAIDVAYWWHRPKHLVGYSWFASNVSLTVELMRFVSHAIRLQFCAFLFMLVAFAAASQNSSCRSATGCSKSVAFAGVWLTMMTAVTCVVGTTVFRKVATITDAVQMC